MPTDAVLFWRDNDTRKALVAFDTLDKLIAAKPLQVLEFDANNSLIDTTEDPQINVSNDPHYDPTGDPKVEKQYNGNFGRQLILTIKSDVDQTAWRTKLKDFVNMVSVEPLYHEAGIFGFFHPKLADYNVDPTNEFGYTIDRAPKSYPSGAQTVTITVTMTLGGNQKTAA
jgi:hypothetical protein